MKILALDTTGKQAGAAIVDNYITIGEIMINAQSGPKAWHHSQILMPAVERMLYLSGQEISDMDYVAYTAGPGSFTGIRIGASTALGLAHSIGKPAIAVPTLDSLAYNMLGVLPHGWLVVPLMDARRGQVYAAIYRTTELGELTRLTDYFAAPVTEVMERVGELNAPTLLLGDGADEYKAEIQAIAPSVRFATQNANRQRPASVGLCALHQIANTSRHSRLDQGRIGEQFAEQATSPEPPNLCSTHTPNLIYIRDPQAVRSAKAVKP